MVFTLYKCVQKYVMLVPTEVRTSFEALGTGRRGRVESGGFNVAKPGLDSSKQTTTELS